MFRNLVTKIKEVLAKLGIIKSINSMNDLPNIKVNEDFYSNIEDWKALYKGYLEKWHNVKYMTIDGEKQRKMTTLQMPKVLSQELAMLIFNERCEISVSDEKFNENIQNVFKKNRFNSTFQTHIEYMLALGGVVTKPYVDSNGEIVINYVNADCFVPISWSNRRIEEGVFRNDFTKNGEKYTQLEWHLFKREENGTNTITIKNEVYKNAQDGSLGVKVSLKQFFPNLEEETIITNATIPLFVYTKPNTANNIDLESPLGISVFANSLDVLKSLDIAFDSFQREFRLGRKRILVPASAIKTVIDKDGIPQRYFDSTDETYEAMNFGMDSTGQEIKDISVELRVDEHISAINAMLDLISLQIGFSSGTFSFRDGGIVATKTATEVISENSKTFKTKQSHENQIEAGITDLIECIRQLADLYDLFPTPSEKYDVTVMFDDSIAEDKAGDVNMQVLLLSNGLTTHIKAIQKIHGYTEEEAILFYEQIKKENETVNLEGISGMFGSEG